MGEIRESPSPSGSVKSVGSWACRPECRSAAATKNALSVGGERALSLAVAKHLDLGSPPGDPCSAQRSGPRYSFAVGVHVRRPDRSLGVRDPVTVAVAASSKRELCRLCRCDYDVTGLRDSDEPIAVLVASVENLGAYALSDHFDETGPEQVGCVAARASVLRDRCSGAGFAKRDVVASRTRRHVVPRYRAAATACV